MTARLSVKRAKWLIACGVLLVALGLLWWQRVPLQRWYCLRELLAATPEERELWIARLAALDEDALPAVHEGLCCEDAQGCANTEAVLARLLRQWGPEDARTLRTLDALNVGFARFSVPGQEALLELHLALLAENQGPLSPPWLAALQELLPLTASSTAAGVQLRAVALADVLLERSTEARIIVACRTVIQRGLSAGSGEVRQRAVHVTMHARFREDAELLKQVVPLLRADDAPLRCAAVLALGAARQVLHEDDLLPLLHDADAEVRRLTEIALRSRGLQENQLALARLLTHPQPRTRLQLVHRLRDESEIDPGVWLQQLLQDPSPAVRAAAVREARQHRNAQLDARLRELAQNDPSPTVRQLAVYYLQQLPSE